MNHFSGREDPLKTTWRIVAALLVLGALAIGATAASARGGDDGKGDGKGGAAARLFTLAPDPAANPEGIEYDKRRKAFYVSSTGDGTIYRGTLGSSTVVPFITSLMFSLVSVSTMPVRAFGALMPSRKLLTVPAPSAP